MITWRMNNMGNVEIWNGTGVDFDTESDLYLQSEDEVIEFLQLIDKTLDDVSIGEWGVCEDVGYFEEEGRKVYEEEWKSMMDSFVRAKSISNIEFMWSQYESIKSKGYFIIPF